MSSETNKGIPLGENFSNEGLPEGTRRFQDARTTQLLSDMWKRQIVFYNRTQLCIDPGFNVDRNHMPGLGSLEVEVSSPQSSTFKGQLHPEVEGHSWFKGIAVKTGKGQVLIFSGWMPLRIEDETQAPIVYTTGDIQDEAVRDIILMYTSNIAKKIKASELQLTNERLKD